MCFTINSFLARQRTELKLFFINDRCFVCIIKGGKPSNRVSQNFCFTRKDSCVIWRATDQGKNVQLYLNINETIAWREKLTLWINLFGESVLLSRCSKHLREKDVYVAIRTDDSRTKLVRFNFSISHRCARIEHGSERVWIEARYGVLLNDSCSQVYSQRHCNTSVPREEKRQESKSEKERQRETKRERDRAREWRGREGMPRWSNHYFGRA